MVFNPNQRGIPYEFFDVTKSFILTKVGGIHLNLLVVLLLVYEDE